MSTQRPEYHIIIKVFKGQATQSERDRVAYWLKSNSPGRVEYKKLRLTWENYGNHANNYQPDLSEALTKVVSLTDKSDNSKWYLLAASIALVLGFGIFLIGKEDSRKLATHTIFAGKGHQEVLLPDGTIIKLKAGSELTYPKEFALENRTVELKGEAFFDVHHDPERPFVVRQHNLTIKVLGTQFLVSPKSESLEVILFSGAVELQSGEQSLQLSPGETARVGDDLVKSSNVEKGSFSWMTEKLEFRGETLPKVLRSLELYYQVEINVLGDISTKRLTATFKSQPIEEVLTTIAQIHGLQIIKKSNNHFYLLLQ